jgi:putative Mn2+ efflux pump MntP
MAKRFSKFALYAGGGLVLLMLIGMIISSVFNLSPEEVKSLNSVEEWMVFRLIIYAGVVVFWVPICKWLTLGKVRRKDVSDQERSKLMEKREEDIAFLKTYWWKVALLLAFFEFVFIQQMGM